MKSSIPFTGLLLQAGLSLAKPYAYERQGMVFNAGPRDEISAENEAALGTREMSLDQVDVADRCLGSYNLIATGTGPSPTGQPDPDFDFFDFCSSFIRPTKTYTVTIRPTTPPVVTITVTATRSSSTSSSPPSPTTKSTSDGPSTVTVTVTATKPTTTKSSTSDEPPVVTITVTATKPTTSKTSTSSLSLPLTTSSSKVPATAITSTSPSTSIPPPTTATQTPTVVTPPTATGTLCPTAVAGQSCGITGWGYAENNLYSGSSISAADCHQLCLANSDCKSFQTQDSTYPAPLCNLYKVDSSGNNTIAGASSPYIFYDRGCPDYAPAACTKVAPPATTAKPTLTLGLAKEKRQRGPQTLPWFLGPFGKEVVSEICSCIITLAPPTISYTTTIRG